jgi:tRNA (cmo5U34)-methyltransferase
MTYRYPHREFDYVIASSTLHHLVDDEKRQLYPKLREALTKDGCLIVGDYFVSAEIAEQRLEQYNQLISRGVDLRNGKYHFDIPTTVENEKRLLVEAGFASADTVWESSNFSIIAAS